MTTTDPITQEFRTQIKRYLFNNKLTQRQIAKTLGVCESNIYHVLNGHSSILPRSMYRILDVLNLKMEIKIGEYK